MINIGIHKINQILEKEIAELKDQDVKAEARKAQKRMNEILLSGKYDFFENFKCCVLDKVKKEKENKKPKKKEHHAKAYINKLLINIGHMESNCALETFRMIPNFKM